MKLPVGAVTAALKRSNTPSGPGLSDIGRWLETLDTLGQKQADLETKEFNSALHPRDKHGKFAVLGAAVELDDGKRGTITGIDKGGNVAVTLANGDNHSVPGRTLSVLHGPDRGSVALTHRDARGRQMQAGDAVHLKSGATDTVSGLLGTPGVVNLTSTGMVPARSVHIDSRHGGITPHDKHGRVLGEGDKAVALSGRSGTVETVKPNGEVVMRMDDGKGRVTFPAATLAHADGAPAATVVPVDAAAAARRPKVIVTPKAVAPAAGAPKEPDWSALGAQVRNAKVGSFKDPRSRAAQARLGDAVEAGRWGAAKELALNIDGYEAHSFVPAGTGGRRAMEKLLTLLAPKVAEQQAALAAQRAAKASPSSPVGDGKPAAVAATLPAGAPHTPYAVPTVPGSEGARPLPAAQALEHYRSFGYMGVNNLLGGQTGGRQEVKDRDAIAGLDAAMRPASSEVTLWRGVDGELHPDGFAVGTVVNQPGYASVTSSRSVAKQFATEYGSTKPAVLKLTVPAAVGRATPRAGEGETILQRGLSYRITKVTKVGGVTTMEGEVFDPKASASPAPKVPGTASPSPASAFRKIDSAWGNAWYAQQPLTKDQAASVRSYTTNSYQRINRFLRTGTANKDGTTPSAALVVAQVQKATANIDAGMRPIPDDVLVRRGVDLNGFGADESTDLASFVGRTFHESGYLSTTAKDVGFKRRVQMEVLVPKGTPGVWVDPASIYQSLQPEQELLLGRGLRYTIVKVERLHPAHTWEAKWKVVVRVIPS